MLKLIPNVKTLEVKAGFLNADTVCFDGFVGDERILEAVKKLPYGESGAKLQIAVNGNGGEGYELTISENDIYIAADGVAGAFYAIQTLKQIFTHSEIPCLHIIDYPDFKHRGFYHDATRGKIPTVETVKDLVDKMAYYKLNSLQLYVEHTYEFEEYKDLNERLGCFTGEELKEIDAYCKANFIDFIPSLSTFGHLYELLCQDKYKHLRVLKECNEYNTWRSRMMHHTIDPLNPQSIEVIKSLIDQYIPNFESEYFNICCDETFDLKLYEEQGKDVGKLYLDFVKQIVDHVYSKGKKVMMWADILLKYPETISLLPEDVCFLNWDYSVNPKEENIIKYKDMNRSQIVCPGTSTWSRLCENIDVEEKNISLMAEYGYKHGALGVLNTNWGDWANPCSLELAMYGMVLGAEKSWSVKTEIDKEFYDRINFLLYENENGIQYLKELNGLHNHISWWDICEIYSRHKNKLDPFENISPAELSDIKAACQSFSDKLKSQIWKNDEYRQEMLIAVDGLCLIAELMEKLSGKKSNRTVDTFEWLSRFSEKWLEKNKESELFRIKEMFRYLEENCK